MGRRPARPSGGAVVRGGWAFGVLGTLLGCTSRLPPAEGASAVGPPPLPASVDPVAGGGPLYGYWGLNGYVTPEGLAGARGGLRMAVFHTAGMDPEFLVDELLPMVRAAGVRVSLRLTGDHHHYTTAGGDFDLHAWKAVLARWEGSGIHPFIDDGTIVSHMILDDIVNFPGRDPTAAELDEMARYSKEILPGLVTFVREKATGLPEPEGGRYLHVDAVVNQYKAAEGDVAAYTRAQGARSRELGLAIINGLNIANGGDGSSGQPGWGEGKFAMSGAEITRYGEVLAAAPGLTMFLNWEYDGREIWSDGSVGSTWFNQPAQHEALVSLGAVVARRPLVPLEKPR